MKHRAISHNYYFTGGIILLCISIGMVALGAPVTLWNLETEGDTFTESLIEGFSIVPSAFTLTDPLRFTVQGNSSDPLPSLTLTESLFRPPRFS